MTIVKWCKSLRPWLAGPGGLLLAAALASPAHAIEVQCGDFGDGDAFGWAVSSGGDYDGDGKQDIAVGAPCAWVTRALPEGDPEAVRVTQEKAGRVRIFSGATGRVLVSLKGSAAQERYGSALAFVPDLNGDGKDELAIGASTFDAPKDTGGFRIGAGRVEVWSGRQGGTILWQTWGGNEAANFGESIAAISDLNGDHKADIAVGAGRGQASNSRDGVAYVLSGASGAVLAQDAGEIEEGRWASLVGYAGDVNGDGTGDWLASSNILSLHEDEILDVAAAEAVTTTTTTDTTLVTTTTTSTTTTTLVDRVGRLKILSGQAPFEALLDITGSEPRQRLGRAAEATTDGNGDGLADVWIGSSGASYGAVAEAGAIDLYTGSGTRIRRIREPSPQSFAGFGTAIAVPGSLDGGAGKDVVGGAPFGRVSSRPDVGRVHAFDASSGALLWSQSGSITGARFGNSLAGGLDFDGDGVGDVVAGSPGASPNGRRGAGAAYVLSGKNGKILASFAGRRGRETHLFISGPGLDRRPVIRSFDPFGRRREAEIRAYQDRPGNRLSMAVLDDGDRTSKPLLVVGAGKGGGTPTFSVYHATRRRLRVTAPFAAGTPGYTGGLNVEGGNFALQAGNEIAVAPADDITGTADIYVYRRDTDPFGRLGWKKARELPIPAFKKTDTFEGTLINAVGVNMASANLVEAATAATETDEIVVAPAEGLPVVKVLNTLTGATLFQWQAFLESGPSFTTNSGTSIAIANLKGNGSRQILTAPARGQLLVRAWKFNGQEFSMTDPGPQVQFFVKQFGSFEGGLTIAAADVDFDGADEIIVAPGPGIAARILAYEADGTPVSSWSTMVFQPFGPLATGGLTLVGMNDFWKP